MRRILFALLVGVALSAPLSSASVDGLTIYSSSTGAGPGHDRVRARVDL